MTGVDTEASRSGIPAAETGCSLTPWKLVYLSGVGRPGGRPSHRCIVRRFPPTRSQCCVLTEVLSRRLSFT